MHLWCLPCRESRDGVVKDVVEQLLSQLLLYVVAEVVRHIQYSLPQRVLCNSIIRGCKQCTSVESIEGRNELRTLEKLNKGNIVGIGVENVEDISGERVYRRSLDR